MASAFVFHKVSAHHQFANGTYFTSSALVLKFSAFFFRALMFAGYEGHIECVQVLLKANASVTVHNSQNQ